MLPLAALVLAAAVQTPAPIVLHPGEHRDLPFTQDVTSARSISPKIVGATSPSPRHVLLEAKHLGKTVVRVATVGGGNRLLDVRVEPLPPVQPHLRSELEFEDEDEDLEAGHAAPGKPDPVRFGGKLVKNARCDPPDEDETPDAVDAEIAEARSKLVADRGAAGAAAAESILFPLLKKTPTAARAYLYIGVAEVRLGHDAAGARAYETFLRSCPTTVHAQRVRGLLDEYVQQKAQLAARRTPKR